eukprot:1195806-Prorocentrum_minimum.AAC.9
MPYQVKLFRETTCKDALWMSIAVVMPYQVKLFRETTCKDALWVSIAVAFGDTRSENQTTISDVTG